MQTTADGGKAFYGWHDSTLNIDCGFARATDDVERCLPISTVTFIAPAAGAQYYADGACATPISLGVGTFGCASAIAYSIESVNAITCLDVGGYPTTAQSKVHAVGAALTSPIGYKPSSGAACAMVTIPTNSTYYSANPAEVSPSMFAQGSIVTE